MLRVVVYLNKTPVIDTHAVRIKPQNAKEGDLCTYRLEDGSEIRNRYQIGKGSATLAIKLLQKFLDTGDFVNHSSPSELAKNFLSYYGAWQVQKK